MSKDHNPEAERAAPELANCPFCASNDVATHEHFTGHGYMVLCHNCTAEGPLHDAKALAAEWWNRRAPAVGEDGLPPLPKAALESWHIPGKPGHYYTAEQVRQAQRDAVAADQRARQNHKEITS
jgi:Lar family restriction alleviation protein